MMRMENQRRLEAVVLSTQHDEEVTQEQIHEDIKKYVFDPVLPAGYELMRHTKIFHQPNRPFRNRWTTRRCRSDRT